ncbi:MAG TPA: PEP-CTERM sorting domain-containing protein [Verrucomicrobiae bacterium]|nr:PEP-CTERM sorting domain-containing protein [Verrucomicrobiae bacterium]
MNKISAITIVVACSLGVAAQGQTIIDPLTGSLIGNYTDYLVNDSGSDGASSTTFTESASGLQANFVGTVADPEQALFLAPAGDFSTTFAVGDTLMVDTAVANSSIEEDLGLAISADDPVAAGANGNTRGDFDWASISLRPSQTAIRQNTSISGTVTTASDVITLNTTTFPEVTALYISWDTPLTFTLGYVINGVETPDDTVTFESGSTIGDEIGFYGDMRDSGGTTLGDFTDLTISPIPEPSTLALCGMGLAGSLLVLRRKK